MLALLSLAGLAALALHLLNEDQARQRQRRIAQSPYRNAPPPAAPIPPSTRAYLGPRRPRSAASRARKRNR